MSWNERQDDYSSVAYWYQTGEPTFSARAPSGPDRHLPSLERVIAYARDGATHGEGDTKKQRLDFFAGPQLLYMPKKQEAPGSRSPSRSRRKSRSDCSST